MGTEKGLKLSTLLKYEFYKLMASTSQLTKVFKVRKVDGTRQDIRTNKVDYKFSNIRYSATLDQEDDNGLSEFMR